jgi:PKD repeat protein/glucose/arabinose dehydrogenase
MLQRGRPLLYLVFMSLVGTTTLVSSSSARPPNFAIDDAVPGAGFQVPTDMVFLKDGRFLVAEKRGRVYEVRNGVKRPNPIWSAEDEVLDQGDRGLLSIAIDPNYYLNHYLYLLYTVDPDTNGTDTNAVGFGRLTRYQVNFTDSASVIPGSRTILMGTDWPNGPVSASDSHTIGTLCWGNDGSLLVSTGDGAHYEYMDAGGHDPGAFGAGRTNPNEDIGSFRSQDITSLAGKLLRLNPANGHGYASNPFVDGNLSSVRSRVWCYGLRNPFRFSRRPGSGSPDTSAANPGVFYIADVGWTTFEEANVAATGGMNFGWPCYEGIGTQDAYQAANPAHNGCGSFGSPTNPSGPTPPLATWHHSLASASRPPGFIGNCATGGTFYIGTQYPATYRGQYLFSDYGQDWIKLATVDINDNLIGISGFEDSGAGGPVDFAVDPISGDVFYVAITLQQVRRIRYTGSNNGNTPPTASIAGTPLTGSYPLTVSFSSTGTSDPDGDPISTSWVFADGTGSTQANPTHVFTTAGTFAVQLTVSDGRGGTDIKYITVTVNPPSIPFPSTPVLDSFTRPNGAVGAPWTDETAEFAINSNALTQQNGGDSYLVWSGPSFGPDQEAFVTLSTINASAREHNLMLKTQGTMGSSGHLEVSYVASESRVIVAIFTPPATWQTFASLTGLPFVAGDRFGARTLAGGTVQVYRNSTLVATTSIASSPLATLGGRIGLSCAGASGSRFDDFGGGNLVSNVNTPPTASILSPVNNSFYYDGQTINLSGSASDAQSPTDSLGFTWVVDLIHNNHVHPAIATRQGPTSSIVGTNHDDGTGVHLLIKLTAKDPAGLVSDTAKVSIWPEIDLVPSAVTATPDPSTAGQSTHFTFSLSNLGRMPAPLSHWVLRAGTAVLAQGDVTVPALGSVALSADATLATVGNIPLRLAADSLGAVFESNETNNASMRTLVVSPSGGNTPPVAVAAGVPSSGNAPLTVNFSGAASTDANGDSLTYAWTFGDGGTATGRLTSHTYSAGSFAAVLTVNDGRGGTDTASVAVSVTAPPPGTFPQTSALDSFNRANGSVGSNWVDEPNAFTITSNVVGAQSGDHYIEWNGAVFGPDQECFVTISTVSASAVEQNLMLKTQGASWSAGHLEISYSAPTSRVIVYTFTPPGNWQTIGSINGVTFVAGDRFGARALANGSVQLYRNATLLGTVSVSGWSFAGAGGRIGLSVGNAPAARYDDFGGGNYSATPVNTPPVAVAAGVPQSGNAPLSVNFSGAASTDANGDSLTYAWTFGDGGTATGRLTSHTYAAGSFAAILTVNDGHGGTDTASVAVSSLTPNVAPVAVAAGVPTSGQAPLSVNFSGAASTDANGDSLTYAWTFGDGGTATGRLTSHTYAAGSFAAILTVTDGRGGTDTASVAVSVTPPPANIAPVAVAAGVPSNGTAPLLVNFSGAASTDANGDSLTYAWTFGDGGTANGRLTSHTYGAGSFAAILTVSDGRGGTDTASVAVSVTAPPPGTFPQNAVLDNFNRANGAPGANWIDQTAQFSIASNTLAGAAGDHYLEWATSFGPDQEAYLTFGTVAATGVEQNLMLKTQGTSWSAGHIEISYNAPTSRVFVYTFTPPGNWQTLGQISGVTFVAGDRFGARAFANGTVTVYRNATLIGTVSVSGWSFAASGGRIGVSVGNASTARFDDFGGGSITGVTALSGMPSPVASRASTPDGLELAKPYPNPTTGAIQLALALPSEETVSFAVLDIQGREVWSAPSRAYAAGRWTLTWDGRTAQGPANPGVYLLRVGIGRQVLMRRVAMIR